jgi:hypothetical protein
LCELGCFLIARVTVRNGVRGDLLKARTFIDPATTIALFAEVFLEREACPRFFKAGLASLQLRHCCVRYSLPWLFRQFVILSPAKDLSWFRS